MYCCSVQLSPFTEFSDSNSYGVNPDFSLLLFAAGYASGQLALEEFGPEVDLGDLKQYLIPLTDASEKEIKGEVLYVDHFGNCQTNVSPEELRGLNLSIGSNILCSNILIKSSLLVPDTRGALKMLPTPVSCSEPVPGNKGNS